MAPTKERRENTMNLIPRSRIDQYSDLGIAQTSCDRRVKSSMVILGDNNKYWVVMRGDAKKLVAAGYQIA